MSGRLPDMDRTLRPRTKINSTTPFPAHAAALVKDTDLPKPDPRRLTGMHRHTARR
ncbi:hypothetical protein [Streptomyces albipurpureus]|uniref:Uncharacterized protein n=1 Tax=Streptomyces albipurpureus TaxID=2897419 RepID=A0ABT0UX94_9ACTN|nr:hypothetical protein [Streptomyces sp. CWNU-1]MCM2392735.1 hypothetical protein [Streptomyces sp. CWNU-1]